MVRVLDLETLEGIGLVVRDIMGVYGRIDVLVNNAAMVHPQKYLQDIKLPVFMNLLKVNLLAPFLLMHYVVPIMLDQGHGVVVNVASKAARYAVPKMAAYNSSKAALVSLTQTCAKELLAQGSSVRCVSVSPGGTRTPMRVEVYGTEDADKQQSPEVVANVITEIATGHRGMFSVPNGADVLVWKGEVEVHEMPNLS